MGRNLIKDLRSKWDVRSWARGKMKLAADRLEELEFRADAQQYLLAVISRQKTLIEAAAPVIEQAREYIWKNGPFAKNQKAGLLIRNLVEHIDAISSAGKSLSSGESPQ